MKLSLADKLALIYTSAGSQRNVAALVGISHQTIGRILHRSMEGGDLSAYEKRPGLADAVNTAFAIHSELTRQQAREDGIPTVRGLPVFQARMTRNDGDPSPRIAANHTHWLSDRLRNEWINRVHQTRFYAAAVVQSKVNLRNYMRQAQERAQQRRQRYGLPPTDKQIQSKIELNKALQAHQEIKQVYTKTVFLTQDAERAIAEIDRQLQQKHAPATGEQGTLFASSIYLQQDTRPPEKRNAGKPQKRKARGNKGTARKAR